MKNILITGGAGFIGSNLCEYYIEKSYNVVCLDNFSTGHQSNIEKLISNNRFKLIKGDIRNIVDCKAATKDIDIVLHQAALGSVPRSIKDPITTNEVNISGFLNMLVTAKDNNVKRFIYAASSSTYGDSELLPKVEDQIGKPLSPYAITKYVNELYAENFSKLFGMETIGLRYFNVFGRRQDPQSHYAAVIPKLILQFIKYESPTINGSGTFSRDFTYIDNVILMNDLAINTSSEKAINTIYNTACGDRTTLTELALYIKNILSEYDPKIAEVPIIYGPERIGDIPHSQASISKAKNLLGYNPLFDINDGLKQTINWYWTQLKPIKIEK